MTMSFTTSTITNIMYNHSLNSAINDIENYTQWMKEDIEMNVVHPTVGQLYLENFASTRQKLQTVHQQLDHFLED